MAKRAHKIEASKQGKLPIERAVKILEREEVIYREYGDDKKADVLSDAKAALTDAPTKAATITNQAASENTLFEFTVPEFTDPDTALNYEVVMVDDSTGAETPLPTGGWLNFDPISRMLSGIPPETDTSGEITLRVKAGTAQSDFKLMVNATDEPTVAVKTPAQSFEEGKDIDITIEKFKDSDSKLNYTFEMFDAAGTLQTWPDWLRFDEKAMKLVGKAPETYAIDTDFTIKVSAGGVSSDFTLTVNANDDPTQPSVINPLTIKEGDKLNFVIPKFTDSDTDISTLTYTLETQDGSPLPSWLKFNSGSMELTGTPPASEYTSNTDIKLKVSAGGVSSDFTLTVEAVDDATVTAEKPDLFEIIDDSSLFGLDFDKMTQAINNGAEINIMGGDAGYLPVTYIILKSNDKNEEQTLDLLKLLVNKGANLNLGKNFKPLHYAVRDVKKNIVKFLLENGADPTLANSNGDMPLDDTKYHLNDSIIRANIDEIIKLLTDKAYVMLSDELKKPAKDIPKIENCLKAGAFKGAINNNDEEVAQALFTQFGDDLIRLELNSGGLILSFDEIKNIPNTEIKTLCKDAYINTANINEAIEHDFADDKVMELIQGGEKPDSINFEKIINSDKINVVKAILEKFGNEIIREKLDGLKPAFNSSNLINIPNDTIRQLCEKAYINTAELDEAFNNGYTDRFNELATPERIGKATLDEALKYQFNDRIDTIIKDTPGILDLPLNGVISASSPLIWAIANNDVEIVKKLIAAKANLNINANDGRAALKIAAYDNKQEIVKLMLDAGADSSAIYKNMGSYNDEIKLIFIKNEATSALQQSKYKTYTFEEIKDLAEKFTTEKQVEILKIVINNQHDPETALTFANTKYNIDQLESLKNFKLTVDNALKIDTNSKYKLFGDLISALKYKKDFSNDTEKNDFAVKLIVEKGKYAIDLIKVLISRKQNVKDALDFKVDLQDATGGKSPEFKAFEYGCTFDDAYIIDSDIKYQALINIITPDFKSGFKFVNTIQALPEAISFIKQFENEHQFKAFADIYENKYFLIEYALQFNNEYKILAYNIGNKVFDKTDYRVLKDFETQPINDYKDYTNYVQSLVTEYFNKGTALMDAIKLKEEIEKLDSNLSTLDYTKATTVTNTKEEAATTADETAEETLTDSAIDETVISEATTVLTIDGDKPFTFKVSPSAKFKSNIEVDIFTPKNEAHEEELPWGLRLDHSTMELKIDPSLLAKNAKNTYIKINQSWADWLLGNPAEYKVETHLKLRLKVGTNKSDFVLKIKNDSVTDQPIENDLSLLKLITDKQNSGEILTLNEVKTALANGAKINIEDSNNQTISGLIVEYKNLSEIDKKQILQEFINYHGDINYGNDGQKPLHVAATNNLFSLTKFMVKYGADPRLKNSAGYLPSELSSDPKIQIYLESQGSAKTLKEELGKIFYSWWNDDLKNQPEGWKLVDWQKVDWDKADWQAISEAINNPEGFKEFIGTNSNSNLPDNLYAHAATAKDDKFTQDMKNAITKLKDIRQGEQFGEVLFNTVAKNIKDIIGFKLVSLLNDHSTVNKSLTPEEKIAFDIEMDQLQVLLTIHSKNISDISLYTLKYDIENSPGLSSDDKSVLIDHIEHPENYGDIH